MTQSKSQLLSSVSQSQIKERFIFFDDYAVLVWNSGELSVVEYESSKLLTTLATRYANSVLSLFGSIHHLEIETPNSRLISLLLVSSLEFIPQFLFDLRFILFQVLKTFNESSQALEELQRFTYAIHLLCQNFTLKRYGKIDLILKSSLAFLRYCNLIPSDYLFYQAGHVFDQLNMPENAYPFYNKFIEIVEVIEGSGYGELIDHTLFLQTDIPQNNFLIKTSNVKKKLFKMNLNPVLSKL
jgi:hypothetical protein